MFHHYRESTAGPRQSVVVPEKLLRKGLAYQPVKCRAMLGKERVPTGTIPEFHVVIHTQQHHVLGDAGELEEPLRDADATLTIGFHLLGLRVVKAKVVLGPTLNGRVLL